MIKVLIRPAAMTLDTVVRLYSNLGMLTQLFENAAVIGLSLYLYSKIGVRGAESQ